MDPQSDRRRRVGGAYRTGQRRLRLGSSAVRHPAGRSPPRTRSDQRLDPPLSGRAQPNRGSMSEPAFSPGDRFWTHYDYRWGTVLALHHTVRDAVHGVTGNPLPDTSWYDVHYDGDPDGEV